MPEDIHAPMIGMGENRELGTWMLGSPVVVPEPTVHPSRIQCRDWDHGITLIICLMHGTTLQ